MCLRFVSPSATKMVLGFVFEFPSAKSSLHLWCLLLAACLFADVATARSQPCFCRNLGHTVRCDGCTRLPNNLPAGVSRLNMTGNRITRIQLATNVSPALAAVTSIYLSNNAIEHLDFGGLSPLKNVMVVDLANNNLVSVDELSIASNNRLKRLILNDNQQLHLVALHSQSLEYIYLRNCGLTSFDKTLLRYLPKLRELHLQGNDELSCEPVVQDLHQDYPQLKVYCDGKTTASKSISATTTATTSPNHSDTRATAHIPNFVYWDVPSEGFPSQTPDAVPQKVQLVLPIPIVPLVVILAVILVAILYRFCQARPGKSGHERLHDEPC